MNKVLLLLTSLFFFQGMNAMVKVKQSADKKLIGDAAQADTRVRKEDVAENATDHYRAAQPARKRNSSFRSAPARIDDEADESEQSSGDSSSSYELPHEGITNDDTTHPGKMFQAIYRGDTLDVPDFLDQGVSVNAKNRSGNTPLHLAVQKATIKTKWLVGELIKRGADIYALNNKNETIFVNADPEMSSLVHKLEKKRDANVSTQNNIAAMQQLPTNEVDKNQTTPSVKKRKSSFRSAPEKGSRIKGEEDESQQSTRGGSFINKEANNDGTLEERLFREISRKNTPKTIALLDEGAPVNAINKLGHTPLHLAARWATKGRMVLVSELIKRGADTSPVNDYGETVFDCADSEVATLMHELVKNRDSDDTKKGAASSRLLTRQSSQTSAPQRTSAKVSQNSKKELVCDAAHVAPHSKKKDSGQIADNGTDKNQTRLPAKKRRSSFRSAPEKRSRLDDEEDEREQSIADSSFIDNEKEGDNDGTLEERLFHEISRKSTLKVIALLDQGAPINVINKLGNTPLHIAARWAKKGKMLIVSELIKRGADTSPVNVHGETVFDCADPEVATLMRELVKNRYIDDTSESDASPTPLKRQSSQTSAPQKTSAPARTRAIGEGNQHELQIQHSAHLSHSPVQRPPLPMGQNTNVQEDGLIEVPLMPLAQKSSVPEQSQLAVQPQEESDQSSRQEKRLKSDLFAVAQKGDRLQLIDLLMQGASLKWRSDKGATIAHVAARHNHLGMVQWLLEIYPDLVDMTDDRGYTIAHVAAQLGHIELVKWLIFRFPDLLMKTDKSRSTALHLAAFKGHFEIVKYVLQKHPELANKLGNKDMSVLMNAICSDNLEMVKWLMRCFPDLIPLLAIKKHSILHVASARSLEVVQHIAQSCPVLLQSEDGLTCLYNAVIANKLEIVQWLAHTYPRLLTIKNNKQETPLDVARSLNKPAIIQILEDAEKRHEQTVLDSSNNSSTKQASQKATSIEDRSNVPVNNQQEHVARNIIIPRQPELADFVDVHKRINGLTVLHCTLLQGTAIIKQFLEMGADINALDNEGKTVLMKAIENRNDELVRSIVSQGASLNIQNNAGQTALILAAQNGLLPLVAFLIENGADTRIQDKNEKTFVAYLDPSIRPLIGVLVAKSARVHNINVSFGGVGGPPPY